MQKYDPLSIEQKWQKIWAKTDPYAAQDFSDKPKKYIAGQFPYPSGAGLHAGHARVYTITDALARFYRQNDYNVLNPIGYDTFGLPAENYAIKTGISPQEATATNIKSFKNQFQRLGISIDWDRELNTSDPQYYKWTQWLFKKLYEKNLAYRAESYQWWCPVDQTVLANEQVETGKCWRCGSIVEKKKMKQWFFRITAYAEELLKNLDDLDWPESVKAAQRNWIGKSIGAGIKFTVDNRPSFTSNDNPPLPDKKFTKRKFVQVFVYDPKIDKYLMIKWKKHPWTSCVGGGVEDDEDIIEAARREVLEETGYKNLRFIRTLGSYRSRFYAANKDVNRDLDATAVLFELVNGDRDKISAAEQAIQEPIWLQRSELKPKDMPAYDETMQAFKWIDGEQAPTENDITIFTTRPDTVFGATFLVLAPEHEIVPGITTEDQRRAVNQYRAAAMKKSELERQENKDKTGVFTGSYAINPVSGERIPVWIADYVLAGYGEGAIMAVPAHDTRDYEFAQKFNIPVRQVVMPFTRDDNNPPRKELKMVERPTVMIHIRDKSTGKFAVLKWHESLEGIVTAVMGGIEDNETAEQAALREIEEEAGFKKSDVKIVKTSPWLTSAEYCASHKGENRRTISQIVLAEINSTKNQKTVDVAETKKHTLAWVDEAKVYETLTPADQKICWEFIHNETAYTGEGKLINSGQFTGQSSSEARDSIVKWLKQNKLGREKVQYKMRDWLISRQRYWGAPIPIAYDKDDNEHLIPDDQLPVILPKIDDYKPDNSGRSALAKYPDWKTNIDGQEMDLETDTLDGFACSSWYLLRYADPHNTKKAWDKKKVDYWNPVDIYVGGDHATTHQLYVRFWTYVFRDLGLLSFSEPIKKFIYHGYILAPDGTKMSKSKGNVIDPLEIVDNGYGADTLRTYILFMGPYRADVAWDTAGVGGVFRFLNRVWKLTQDFLAQPIASKDGHLLRAQHKTIKKVTHDIKTGGFNTAIAALMEYLNALSKEPKNTSKENITTLLKLLAPFAPHLANELLEQLGETDEWPAYDENLTIDDAINIGVQVNGKVRGDIEVSKSTTESEALTLAEEQENIQNHLKGKKIFKTIYIPGKILNIITSK